MVHLIDLVGLVYGHSHVVQRDWKGAMSIGNRAGVTTVEYVRATTRSTTTVSVKKGTKLNHSAQVHVVACSGCKFCQRAVNSGRSDC